MREGLWRREASLIAPKAIALLKHVVAEMATVRPWIH